MSYVPGGSPIELASYYRRFRSYYAYCEMETKDWFVRNVSHDAVVIDVGANIGYYTILFSRLAPNGHVYAFEPTKTFRMLMRNLEHHRVANASTFRLALGQVSGRRRDRIARVWGRRLERRNYEFTTLDDFVRDQKLTRVDFIKIDCDGFDLDVLRGAEETLERFDPSVVVELADVALSLRGQFSSEALAWLAARGYRQALVLEHCNFLLKRASDLAIGAHGGGIELLFRESIGERSR